MLIYLIVLAGACLALLIRATLRPKLFYEFPYLMAAAFTAFILPQAYAAYLTEWGGWHLDAGLIMATLCLAACWVGYLPRPHPALLEKFNVKVDPARFFHGGVLLVAIGYYFTHRFGTLDEEELST